MKSMTTKQYIRKTIFISGLLVTLQSCSVTKDYVRPDAVATESLYRTENLSNDSTSLADVTWKTMFTDLALQHYIEEGLQNNMDVRIAIQQLMAAEAYAKQGKAGYLPTANVGVNASHQQFSENSQFGAIFSGGLNSFDITGNVSWEIDVWGKIRSQKRATQAAFLQSYAGHQAVKTRLISSIATTYYNLLALDAQLEVIEKTIAARESSIETIKAMKKSGQASQIAVDQNIAQYNNAKALQVDIEVAIFKTENTLSILLGKPGQKLERSSLATQNITQELKLGVPALLLSNRPDVLAAEYKLIQAFEQTNIARANFYPSLILTASGGFQSIELDKLLSLNSLFATVVGGLTQPILNQRRLKTEKEVALANQEQALLQFKKTLLIAGNEVSNALFSYQSETKKIAFRENEVNALRTAEQNSEALLKSGLANYLDLLTARQSALSAEINSINTKLQQLGAIVNLYEALGGGWK
ncbi:TolC family protein [Putridiphycobacter roseus]|uniref:TolC family protein n=1 Tax=Putridiphycobacter roseus TaxID=2219161 RepID=A0A2W1NJD3_9FLAO|nr:efflux transporter outer membrane subunit [Putridiphycobacter roseus]PZE18066.1 TolC family protein [Putridiphycobacter roseus]